MVHGTPLNIITTPDSIFHSTPVISNMERKKISRVARDKYSTITTTVTNVITDYQKLYVF